MAASFLGLAMPVTIYEGAGPLVIPGIDLVFLGIPGVFTYNIGQRGFSNPVSVSALKRAVMPQVFSSAS